MKKSILILLSIVCGLNMSIFAREHPQYIGGKVVDSYTRELMKEFQADLLRPDSTYSMLNSK